MDAIYYNLNAKKVKVSGGAELLTFVPIPVSAPSEGSGEVLDFARCRQKLETKNAWKDLSNLSGGVMGGEEDYEVPAPRTCRSHATTTHALRGPNAGAGPLNADWLELCASACAILVSLAAAAAFLRLV